MLKLPNCFTTWQAQDFFDVDKIVPKLERPRKRITELMLKSLSEKQQPNSSNKCFLPRFYRSPLELVGMDKVEQIKLSINKMIGDDVLKQRAVVTDKSEVLSCNLAVTSIGYKSIQADKAIPFDEKSGNEAIFLPSTLCLPNYIESVYIISIFLIINGNVMILIKNTIRQIK